MITRLARVTIVVRDHDEALAFYTEKLGFETRADVPFGPGARWLTVAPPQQRDLEIVLLRPDPAFHGERQAAEMLANVGKNPTWVLYSTDCQGDYGRLVERGVTFSSAPTEQPYGLEAVFLDLYGNNYSLLQPAEAMG
jgi:catechol 2,3-dioxygenase-like lactoylglutathione lyase family enzyme